MPKNKIAKYISGQGIVYVTVAANQKVIEVQKVNQKGKILDIPSNRQARKELSLAAYSLYMHFILNLPGYQEALSIKKVTESCALSTKTYYKAVDELIEKKYLVRRPSTQFEEYYHFLESPSLSAQDQDPTVVGLQPDSSSDEI